MSKVSFTNEISEVMYQKVKGIECLDLYRLFSKNEYFDIAISLAYLSLSKEKIIEKEIKNPNRIDRLTKKVKESEIDKVFSPGFAEEMPRIYYAQENNNLWILDNIRDSIMHGACDIDDNKKCFIINNTQYDRLLKAEIPFSWIIAYAKNDIFSKKLVDKYVIRNYYYNKDKKDKSPLNTKRELYNTILYNVYLTGKQFNIADIEKRINELFYLYSNDYIKDEDIDKYKDNISPVNKRYDIKYLASFLEAKNKVIKKINEEYPDINIKISINNNKYKLNKKIIKKIPNYFYDYDAMYSVFNRTLSKKSVSLLKYISNIIENKDKFQTEEIMLKQTYEEKVKIIHEYLTGEKNINTKANTLSVILENDLKILRPIFLNIYGLSTLVINHETLFNDYFKNKKPTQFGLRVLSKKPYLDYAKGIKKLIMEELKIKIKLEEKNNQLNNCQDDNIKKIISKSITELESLLTEINNQKGDLYYDRVVKEDEKDPEIINNLLEELENLFNNFENEKGKYEKKKIRKQIGKKLEEIISEETKYTYGFCNNMEDALSIIRNSFSHIGRISVGKNNGTYTNVYLYDYDTNGEKSGEVTCEYINLISLLKDPYYYLYEKEKLSKTR